MIEYSTSRMHVATVLDRRHAADHQTLDHWPSLLTVTEDTSRQPARAQATLTSGRPLREVARWHASMRRWDASIRRCDGVPPATTIELVDAQGTDLR